MERTKYLIDTNVFNLIEDGKFDVALLSDGVLYATHHQIDEFKQCANSERTQALVRQLNAVGVADAPTSVMVWDLSSWDQACFGTEQANELYDKAVCRIRELDQERKKREPKQPFNRERDALLAVTASSDGYVLVTNDAVLAEVAKEIGAMVRRV